MGFGRSFPRSARACDHQVKARDHDDQAVEKAPGPEGIAWNSGNGAVAIVPPQQTVVVGRVAMSAIELRQAGDFLRRPAGQVDEFRGDDLPVLPFAFS
jgi:hypothetical protein